MLKTSLNNTQNVRIFATKKEKNISFYFELNSGECYYLMSHSDSPILWSYYKDGTTIREITRMKPQRTPSTQKLIHFNDHLLKVVDSFIRYELLFDDARGA